MRREGGLSARPASLAKPASINQIARDRRHRRDRVVSYAVLHARGTLPVIARERKSKNNRRDAETAGDWKPKLPWIKSGWADQEFFPANQKPALIQECDRLDSSHFKSLAAADVFAHDHVVAADHIRLGFGELGAVAFVGTAEKLLLLGAHQPCELILTSLAAVGTGKRVGFPGFLFVEKIALVHLILLSTTEGTEST